MNKPLYELVGELVEIQSAIESSGGEITPDIETALTTLDAALPVKVEGVCKVIRQFEMDEAVFKTEVQRLRDRQSIAANAVARLKDYLKRSLEALGEKSFKTPLFVATICKNSQPSISVDEGAEIPDAFAKVIPATVALDRDKVMEAWRTDPASIPLSINVIESTHLRIR
jgi:hypothetical protein